METIYIIEDEARSLQSIVNSFKQKNTHICGVQYYRNSYENNETKNESVEWGTHVKCWTQEKLLEYIKNEVTNITDDVIFCIDVGLDGGDTYSVIKIINNDKVPTSIEVVKSIVNNAKKEHIIKIRFYSVEVTQGKTTVFIKYLKENIKENITNKRNIDIIYNIFVRPCSSESSILE